MVTIYLWQSAPDRCRDGEWHLGPNAPQATPLQFRCLLSPSRAQQRVELVQAMHPMPAVKPKAMANAITDTLTQTMDVMRVSPGVLDLNPTNI